MTAAAARADLLLTLDPKRALDEAQEIARQTDWLIDAGSAPDFVEVQRLCRLVLDFTTVTTRERKSPTIGECERCGAAVYVTEGFCGGCDAGRG